MSIPELLGTAAGVGFLAGIRLYATVFILGMLIRFGILQLSDAYQHALILGSLPVLIVSGSLGVAEFVSDKVPWFDSVWDSIHTFIRPIGAAVLAFAALGELDPGLRTALTLVTGGVALGSHAAKSATRVAANHSPEPLSNMTLSIAEDLFVPLGLWLTVHFPIIVLSVVLIFLAVLVWTIRRVARYFRERWREAQHKPA